MSFMHIVQTQEALFNKIAEMDNLAYTKFCSYN